MKFSFLSTVGGCKKGTGAGSIGIAGQAFGTLPLRKAVPVALVGNINLYGTGKKRIMKIQQTFPLLF